MRADQLQVDRRFQQAIQDRSRCGSALGDARTWPAGPRLDAEASVRWNRWADVYQARLDQWSYDELVAYRARTGHPDEDLRELWARADVVYHASRIEPWPERRA